MSKKKRREARSQARIRNQTPAEVRISVGDKLAIATFANFECDLVWIATGRIASGQYEGIFVQGPMSGVPITFDEAELETYGARQVTAAEVAAYERTPRRTHVLPPPDGKIFEFADDVDWFESKLSENGVVPRRGAPFTKALAAVRATRSEPTARLSPDELVEVLGAGTFIRALREAYPVLEPELKNSWRLFAGADLCHLRLADQTQERDLSWEVYVAARAAKLTTAIELAEPDVVAVHAGARCGIACKVFYTQQAAGHIEAIVKGARQIQEAQVDRGLVVVNATNMVDHSVLMPRLPDGRTITFPNMKIPQTVLRTRLQKLTAGFRVSGSFLRRVREREKTRAIAVVGFTVTHVQDRPFIVRNIQFLRVSADPALAPDAFEEALAKIL